MLSLLATFPVRGGVPVTFPQFGAMGTLLRHGLARLVGWGALENRMALEWSRSASTPAANARNNLNSRSPWFSSVHHNAARRIQVAHDWSGTARSQFSIAAVSPSKSFSADIPTTPDTALRPTSGTQ
jgi:D-hexose-6-phosphate mutarotase